MLDAHSRSELRALGWTSRALTRAVKDGRLIRARLDRYVQGDAPEHLVEAVRVGGRLGCLSLLAALGVFVFNSAVLHVHMERGDSRMRSPAARDRPLPERLQRRGVVLHWHRLVATPRSATVDVIDALIHATRCQSPRHAVATLDSALHLGLIDTVGLAEVFAHLPARFRTLQTLVDGRAESGTETLVRLMAHLLGCSIDIQVTFDGIGRVDLLLDGWLVVECDSKAHHSSWAQQRKDYRRDRALAKLGYSVLRLMAEDILYSPDEVFLSLRGLITSR